MTPEWERAAREGDLALLSEQIAAGADLDALDRHGQSAVMLAALNGHLEARGLPTLAQELSPGLNG
jgi:ankyrin repeat protein